MRGEEEYEATISAIQESIVAISGSNVLADGKKREMVSRIRSVKSTLEGNRKKGWMRTGEGKELLMVLRNDANEVLEAFKRLETENDYLEELEKKILSFRSSTRKLVEFLKK